ncbi:MAG TPA: protein kinase, partial [Propionibacteriaceae bacterium]|nr:protein kinase [Propionibacteriaceae bacterium]
MPDESTSRGAPRPWQYEVTPRLGPEASTATFPTVFGAGVTMTTVGDPLVGRILDGRYEITQRLARGGMATVYRAVDMRLTRTVAVKVMHVGLGDEAEFARKFDREARAAAKLSHPNVVSVFDQGQDLGGPNSRPYIVMEYVEGQTLRDVLNREAPLPAARALEIIEPVLAALAAAHDAGLVHRDVKPENVLISDRGRIKVADFGLAKAVSSQTSTATQGLLIGTVSYIPPELVVSGMADARSDVYSTGVVLFELLTGRKPHNGDTPIQIAYAHVHRDVPPPSVGPTAGPIPPYVDALVTQATARDASLRQPDAKVLLAQGRRARIAIQRGLRDDPELSRELRIAPRPTSGPKRRDRADDEVTQMMPSPMAAARTQSRPQGGATRTVID